MSIEVTPYKIVDFFLSLLMEILKFMHGRELGDIETVWENAIRLAFQKVLAFVCGDVRDGSEHIRGVSCCPFNAIPMVDSAISCFRIDIKVL